MGVDHGLAPVELGHHRLERGIAEPLVAVAREQADAVGLERIESIFDLAQARFNIRERQRCEHAEAARIVDHEARCKVVALARDPAALRVIADPDTGRGDRRDGRGDAGAVHVLNRFLDRPGEGWRLQQRTHLVDEFWRCDVMMGVDAMRLRGCCSAGATLR